MNKSPFMNASVVSQVHGNPDLMSSDDWPYMRTAESGAAIAVASPDPREVPTSASFRAPGWPMRPQMRQTAPPCGCMPPPTRNFPSQTNYVDESAASSEQDTDGPYTKLVKSTMLPFHTLGVPKHVFKVRETTKLILFLGVAAGGVLLLDLSARLLISIAHNKCANK